MYFFIFLLKISNTVEYISLLWLNTITNMIEFISIDNCYSERQGMMTWNYLSMNTINLPQSGRSPLTLFLPLTNRVTLG